MNDERVSQDNSACKSTAEENPEQLSIILDYNSLLETPNKVKIKQLFDDCVSSSHRSERNLFIQLFSVYKSKRDIRNFLLKIISEHQEVTKIVLTNSTAHFMSDLENKTYSSLELSQYLHFVETCILNPHKNELKEEIVFVFLPLAKLIVKIFTINSDYPSDFPICVDSALKILVIIFGKHNDKICNESLEDLFQNSYKILLMDKVRYDIRQKAALIFMSIFQRKNINFDLENLDSHPSKDFYKEFYSISKKLEGNVSGKAAIHTALINVVSAIETNFLIDIFYILIDVSSIATSLPLEMIDLSQTLMSIMKQFNKLLNSEQFIKILEKSITFLWENVDHQIEMVRDNTRQFLKVLLESSRKFFDNGEPESVKFLLMNIKNMDTNTILFYHMIMALCSNMGCTFLLENFPTLNKLLLENLTHSAIQAIVCNTYKLLMEKHFEETSSLEHNINIVINFWIKPLLLHSKETEACEKILNAALSLHPQMFFELVPNLDELHLLLKCILFTRKNRTDLIDDDLMWKGLIPKEKLKLLALHQDDQVRLSSLAMVVESRKSTEIYSEFDLNFMLSYVKYNLSEDSPHLRKQMTSIYRKAFIRYDASFKLISRELNKPKAVKNYKEIHKQYRNYIVDFLQYLASNLFSGGNFPRRSAALELILLVQPYATDLEWFQFCSEMNLKLLLNLLHDSYESNKKLALEVLKKCPLASFTFLDLEASCNYFENCFVLANEMNPNKSLGASYMFLFVINSTEIFNENVLQHVLNDKYIKGNFNCRVVTINTLLSFLEYKIDSARSDDTGSNIKPLHGLILCITELLKTRDLKSENEEYAKIFKTIIRCSIKVLDLVFPVICSASPEGYLPEGQYGFDTVTVQSTKAQILLIFAWRTMKELTILLAEIIYQSVKVENVNNETLLMSEEGVNFVHDMFIKIFIQAKHRGVFEQAFVGFSSICSTYWKFGNDSKKALIKTWLTKVLGYCSGELDVSDLCATRRSAGLPFFLLSIVATNPDVDHEYMKPIMDCLIKNAQKNNYPELQMHCFNCMRALIRNTVLAEVVQPFVTCAVQTSIAAFNSRNWSVSNAALLLFSTLIIRIFGVQRTTDSENLTMKNKLSVRIFTMRYPGLLEYLLDMLNKQVEGNLTDSKLIYPILLLLTRLCPSHSEEHDTIVRLVQLRPILKHPSHKIREIASRVLLVFAPSKINESLFSNELYSIDCSTSNNVLSGTIMQLINLTSPNILSDKSLEEFLIKNMRLLRHTGKCYTYYTTALYMELLTKLLVCHPNFQKQSVLEDVLNNIALEINNSDTVEGKLKFSTTRLVLMLLLTMKLFDFNKFYLFALNEIVHHLHSEDIALKIFSLQILVHLHVGFHEENVEEPLIYYEDVKIPTNIYNAFNAVVGNASEIFLTFIHKQVVNYLSKKIENIKQENKEIILYDLILLRYYYSCVLFTDDFNKITSEQLEKRIVKVFNVLVDLITLDCEEITAASICCIRVLLIQIKNNIAMIKLLDFERFISAISRFNIPEVTDSLKQALSNLLKDLDCLYNNTTILKAKELSLIYHIMMELIEDDNGNIRNTISEISTDNILAKKLNIKDWKPIPYIARKTILILSIKNLEERSALSFIFGWANRFFETQSTEVSQVFEKSDLNQYADNIPIIEIALEVLKDHFYNKRNNYRVFFKSEVSDDVLYILASCMSLLDTLKNVVTPFIPKTIIEIILEVVTKIKSDTLSLKDEIDFNTFFNNSVKGIIYEKLGFCLSVVNFLLRLFKYKE